MDTPHPNEQVKYCPQCKCKTWTDVNGICEWADMHIEQERRVDSSTAQSEKP